MTGSTLSHYKILAEIGRGGMGIVYKAEDSKLDRVVAIKVLPSAALATDDARERFYREAKAAAQLHHPHIASIFEIDEAVPSDAPHGTEPSPFIVMEFIDGGTLKDEIDKAPMKLKEAVRAAAQVAEALKLAHSKDIVHRDIKSHNVMLTREGDAKVLDFGLAKTAQSTMLTRMGSTLGTVAYMSPEQARGEEVDHRTDIWSLGVMLFEMVAGRLPFAGEYEKAVMYGILNEMAPPLTSLRTGVPMGLEWIVSKCLAKDPNERYQTCADLIVDLKTVDLSASGLSRQSVTAHAGTAGLASGAGESVVAGSASPRHRLTTWFSILLLPLGLALGWILFAVPGGSSNSSTPTRQFQLEIADAQAFGGAKASHDGTRLVGTLVGIDGIPRLERIDLRTGERATIVPGIGSFSLSISQDDEWIAYQTGSEFYRVRMDGGTPVSLMKGDINFYGSLWRPDGSIVVSVLDGAQASLWKVPASGSEPFILAVPDSSSDFTGYIYPTALGDRDRFLVTVRDNTDTFRIGAFDLKSEQIVDVDLGPGSPIAYLESGHLVFFESRFESGRLLVRPFDADKLRFLGPAITVEENAERWAVTVDRFGTYYSESLSDPSAALTWEARLYVNGTVAKVIAQDLPVGSIQPRLSPDGSRVIMRIAMGDHEELQLYDMSTDIMRPFTVTEDGDADNAAWSADGKELIYESNDKLYRRNSNGSGRTVEIPTAEGTGAMDWARSGTWLVHTTRNANGYSELYRIDLPSGESTQLDGGPGTHGWPRISPDERFISYSTIGAGAQAIWVLSVEDGNRKKVVETRSSRQTAWSRDGKFLYFESNTGLYQVPVTTDPYFEALGQPELIIGSELLEFDLVSKGDSILAIVDPRSGGTDGVLSYTVISDWMTELRQIAPVVK